MNWNVRTYESNANIAELLKEIVGTPKHGEYGTWVCTVDDVDETTRTCNCTVAYGNGEKIEKVRLQAARNSEAGQVIIPIAGSYVIVSRSDDGVAFIVATTEIEKILIDTELVQFNGGDNGGLVMISYLLERLNKIEKAVNDLNIAHNNHTHLDPVSGSTGEPSITVTGQQGSTDLSSLEDEKITH